MAGGFYWQAREQEPAQNLASHSDAWMAWSRAAGPSRFASWPEALAALAFAGAGIPAPIPVVVDEVGYLFARAPSLPSELPQRSQRPSAATHRRVRALGPVADLVGEQRS